jgi:hypothetical protein
MPFSGLPTDLPNDLTVAGLSRIFHFSETSRKVPKDQRSTITNPETVISSSNASVESIIEDTVPLHIHDSPWESSHSRKTLQIAPSPGDATPSSPQKSGLPSDISDSISNFQEQSNTYDAREYDISRTQKLVKPARKKAGSMKRPHSKSSGQEDLEATPRRITRSMRKGSK